MQVTKRIETAAISGNKMMTTTAEDLIKLRSGYCESVDGFDYYFFSQWTPSLRTAPRKEKKTGSEKRKPKIVRKVYKPPNPLDIFTLKALEEMIEGFLENSNPQYILTKEGRDLTIRRGFQRRLNFLKQSQDFSNMKWITSNIDRELCLNMIFSGQGVDFVDFACKYLRAHYSHHSYPSSLWDQEVEYAVSMKAEYDEKYIFSEERWPNLEEALQLVSFDIIHLLSCKSEQFQQLVLRHCPLICCGDIETNPGPEVNGNTKRDSKRHSTKVDPIMRLEKLSQRTDQIGKQAEFDKKKLQKVKRQNAAHKQVMKTLFVRESLFSIDHRVRFEFFDEIKNIFETLPLEMRQIMNFADVLASIRILLNYEDSYEAKYLAVRSLYEQFHVEGMALDTIMKMVVGILLHYGLTFKNQVVRESVDQNLDPVSTFITIFLTFMFGRRPGDTFMRSFTMNLGTLPRATEGVHSLIELTKRMCSYVTGHHFGESVSDRIQRLYKQSMSWTTREGLDDIHLNESGFDEVCEAYAEAEELAMVIKPRTAEHMAFTPTLLRIRQFYRQVMTSPVSGHTFRTQPVVLHLIGDPGVGKTLMINAISADALYKIFELQQYSLEERKEKAKDFTKFVYHRPFGHKYETNYNSRLSQVYVIDDANQVAPEYLNDDVPIPAKIINYANNAELLLPVAEVENKRSAYFNSKLIIMTDNMETPDLRYLAEPEAYKRRIDIQLRVSLKESHKMMGPNGVRIADPSKFSSTCFDTSAYEFKHVNGDGKLISYDEVIRLLWVQLVRKHMEFTQHRRNFSAHALRHFEESDNGNSTTVVDSPIIGPEVSVNEALTPTQKQTYDSTSDIRVISPRTESSEVSDDIVSSPTSPLMERESWFGTKKQSFMCGRLKTFSFYEYFSIYVGLLYLKLKVKWYQNPSIKKRLIYFSVFGLVVASIGAWFLRQRKSKGRNREYMERENYNAGTANAPSRNSLLHRGKVQVIRENDDSHILEYNTGTANAPPNIKIDKTKPIIIRECNFTEVDKEIHDAQRFTNDIAIRESVSDPDSLALQRKVVSNMYRITVTGNGKEWTQNGIFLTGRVMVVNNHLLDHVRSDWMNAKIHLWGVRGMYYDIPCERVHRYTAAFPQENGKTVAAYDLIFLEFPVSIQSHVNLVPYLCTYADQQALLSRNMTLISVFNPESAWEVTKQHTTVFWVASDDVWYKTREFHGANTIRLTQGNFEYFAQTTKGVCGSVSMVNDRQFPRKIIGLHSGSANNADKCVGTFIPAEVVKAILDEISYKSTYALGGEVIRECSVKNTIIDDTFTHLTCIPHTIHSSMNSKIRKSILHGQVCQPAKAPAHLGYVLKDGVKIHVVNEALKKYAGANVSVSEIHQNVFKSFLKVQFLSGKPVREISREIAIRGVEGDEFLKAINRSSSPGYPFVKLRDQGKMGKTTFLGQDENFIYDHPVVLEEINKYVDSVHSGERPLCVFTSTAKDELRTLDKVAQGKTRSFAAAPLHFTILFREKYLDLFANVMRERIDNGSLIGINCYGRDWDYLATRLTHISPPDSKRFLAGDFSNFDGTLNRTLLWNMFDVIEEKYGREDDKVCFALWTDITDSLQVFGNTVIEVNRGQPSGNPGTTVINSFYNAGLLYVVIWELCTRYKAYKIRSSLSKHFRAFVYGDDNIMVFSEQLAEILNPTDITECMKEFGMVYTSDDKSSRDLEFKTMYEISILKRRFVFDETNRKWLAPLELISVLEPLNWDKVDDNQLEMKKLQMSINARTAIRELSFHDKLIFDNVQKKIIKACEAASIILDSYCYLDHATARRLLIEEQLPDAEYPTVTEEDVKTSRRDIDPECRGEQPSPIDSFHIGKDWLDLFY